MPHASLETLPPELLHQILCYLSVPTLLTFGRASNRAYAAATRALTTLHLAILPRRIHCTLAFLHTSSWDEPATENFCDGPSLHQICLPTTIPIAAPRHRRHKAPQPTVAPTQHRDALIQLQNRVAADVLSTPSLGNLRALALHMYSLTSPALTDAIATRMPHLRHLHLNFAHPYIHDTCLPAAYWTRPGYLTGSPAWNALAGIGDENMARLRLRSLESLRIERAGITTTQLRRWIEANPALEELTLMNVSGVDGDFVTWLGEHFGWKGRTLRKLALEDCDGLCLKKAEDFEWMERVARTGSFGGEATSGPGQELSLQGCKGVDSTSLMRFLSCRPLDVETFTLPDGRVLKQKRAKEPRGESSTAPTSVGVGGNDVLEQLKALYDISGQDNGNGWMCGMGVIEADT